MLYKVRLIFQFRIHISYIVKSKHFEAIVEIQENYPLLEIVYKDNYIYKKIWFMRVSQFSYLIYHNLKNQVNDSAIQSTS